MGSSVSINEDESAPGSVSQFHPPSGHCQPVRRSASRAHRASDHPSAVTYRSAFPCCEPCARARPRITGTPQRRAASARDDAEYVRKYEGRSQSSKARSGSGLSKGSPGGQPMSLNDARTQWYSLPLTVNALGQPGLISCQSIGQPSPNAGGLPNFFLELAHVGCVTGVSQDVNAHTPADRWLPGPEQLVDQPITSAWHVAYPLQYGIGGVGLGG
jgi:hypothetical protein